MENNIEFEINEDGDVAYLRLQQNDANIESRKKITHQIRLRNLIPDYTGPDIFFDFSSDNFLMGIEILSE